MPTTPASVPVLPHLRRALLLGAAADMSDGQLLEGFVARRDEAAFEGLVRRHGPMVLGVCRRVIGNVHDAEDAFQATFLVLSRKAAGVLPREAVGNWLYGVAYRTARRAKAVAARRWAREKQVTAMPQPTVEPANPLHDVEAILDEELSRLADKYRLPVVLCELEGRSRKEVAERLGLPEGTLSSRLATARKLLAQRLTKRGLTASASALTAMLTTQAASASVPGVLVSNTVKAAALFAAGRAASAMVSPQAAALSEGVLRAMLLTKLKIIASMILVVLLIGLGAGALRQQAPAGEPGAAPQEPGAKTAKGKAVNKLIGTWKLVAAKYDGEQSTLPETATTLKHITPTHYTWLTYDKEGNITRSAGGTYTFTPDEFTQTGIYGQIKGKNTYKYKLEGDRLYWSGNLLGGLTIEEVWERVEKK